MVKPKCLSSVREVRHTSRMWSAAWAPVIQVFWPLIT